MKKEEITSLGLAIGAVVSMIIGISVNYGGWRTTLVLLSWVMLLLAIGAFKQGDPYRMERILRIVFFSAFLFMVIFSLVYVGFTDSHDGWKKLALGAFLLITSCIFAYFCILRKGRLNIRASWLDIDSPPASKQGKGKIKTFNILSIDNNTSCIYYPGLKQLHVTRKLFTDPMKHEEAFQERVFKYDELIEKLGLPLDWEVNGEDSLFSFDLNMSIPKRLATKKKHGSHQRTTGNHVGR